MSNVNMESPPVLSLELQSRYSELITFAIDANGYIIRTRNNLLIGNIDDEEKFKKDNERDLNGFRSRSTNLQMFHNSIMEKAENMVIYLDEDGSKLEENENSFLMVSNVFRRHEYLRETIAVALQLDEEVQSLNEKELLIKLTDNFRNYLRIERTPVGNCLMNNPSRNADFFDGRKSLTPDKHLRCIGMLTLPPELSLLCHNTTGVIPGDTVYEEIRKAYHTPDTIEHLTMSNQIAKQYGEDAVFNVDTFEKSVMNGQRRYEKKLLKDVRRRRRNRIRKDALRRKREAEDALKLERKIKREEKKNKRHDEKIINRNIYEKSN